MNAISNRDGIERRIEADLQANFREFPYSAEQSLVLGAHLLDSEGHSRSLLGQVTARGEDGLTFMTLRFGCGLDEASSDALVRFDRSLTAIGRPQMVNPGVRFHLWVYERRPDVRAIVHTHPPHCVALAMTHMPLRPVTMDAAMLYDDVAYLDNWPGAPEGDEEGQLISRALGDKSSILLSSHGLLATGRSVQEAMYRAVFLERAAAAQLLAAAAGTLRDVGTEAALSGRRAMTRASYVHATMSYLYRKVARTGKYPAFA